MKIFTLIGGISFSMIFVGTLLQNVVITYKTNLSIIICHPIPVAVICSFSIGLATFCFAISYYWKEKVLDEINILLEHHKNHKIILIGLIKQLTLPN